MIRVYDANYSGWHSFNAGCLTREVQHHLKTYCKHLNSTHLQITEPLSFFSTESRVANSLVCTEFTFVKSSNPALHMAENVEMTYKTGKTYETPELSITHYDGEDSITILDATGNATKMRVHAHAVHNTHVVFSISCTQDPNVKTFLCQQKDTVRYVRMHLDIFSSTTAVVFVYNEKCRSCVKIEASWPICVNACYTAKVRGKIANKGYLDAFRVPNGSCGVEFTFPSPLGKLNLYKGDKNCRKITFKASSSLQSVKEALESICRITGISSDFCIAMHMLVFECKTGMAMDITLGGFVHDFCKQVFHDSGCSFEAEIQEVNVHSLVQWDKIDLLFSLLFPEAAVSNNTQEHMKNIVLIMSITRLGTIIFRVSLKQKTRSGAGMAYTKETEDAIVKTLNQLYFSFSTFSSPFTTPPLCAA